VDYGNEQNRQVVEDSISRNRQCMDYFNDMTRHAMQEAMDNLNELNRQAMEHTPEQLRQTMDKVNELKRKRQAFVNAQQQMMIEFQEKANAEGDPIEMARLIGNLVRDGISLVSQFSVILYFIMHCKLKRFLKKTTLWVAF
jgi:TRAP-type C4-dicarboxylate transport system substrate-binding protein